MSDNDPAIPRIITQHVLRVQNHVSHRSRPPTRYFPWTNRRDPDHMFEFPGLMAVDPDGNEAYCYLSPNMDSETPSINIHFGGDGRPEFDEVVFTVEVTWDG